MYTLSFLESICLSALCLKDVFCQMLNRSLKNVFKMFDLDHSIFNTYLNNRGDVCVLSEDKLSQTSIQLQILSESTGYVKGEFRVCMCALEEVHSRCKGSPVRWRSAGPSSAYPEQSSPSARSPTENSHMCCWTPALSEMEYTAKHTLY